MSVPFHIQLLSEELKRRKRRNRRYSLRAFASYFETHPSALSRILSCKQDMSVAIALQVVTKLNLDPETQERFVFSVAQERYKQTLLTLSEGAQIDQLSSALRQSEERYRTLLNVVNQSVSIQELVRNEAGDAVDARYLRVNPTWEAMMDIKQSEAVGTLYSDLFPENQREMLELFERAHRLQTVQRKEVHLVGRDKYHDYLIVPLENDRFMETGIDTTEHRRTRERREYLLELGNLLRDLTDPEEIQSQASQYLGKYLRCTDVKYSEYSQEQTFSTVYRDYTMPDSVSTRETDPTTSSSNNTETTREEPLVILNTQTDLRLSEQERADYQASSIYAIIKVVLKKGDKYVAGLSALNTTPRKWSSFEVEILNETLELTWLAVQRSLAEAALRRQTRFLEVTLSSLPDTVYALNREHKLTYVNQAFQDVIGRDREEILGRTLAELGYEPESVGVFDRKIEKVFAFAKPVQAEYRETSRSGRTGIYHFVLGPVCAEDGSVEMAVGISRDTTDRHRLEQEIRESEARLKVVFEMLPLAIGIIQANGELVLSNREMRKYLPTGKIPSGDGSQTSRWRGFDAEGNLVQPADFPGAKALRGEEYENGLRMTFIDDDGKELPVTVSSRSVRDTNGGITGAFVIVEKLPNN